jgi:hypothetical protein
MAPSQEVPRNNSTTIASLKDAAGKVEFTTEDKKGITSDESSDEELHTVEKGYTEVIVDLPPDEGRRALRKVDFRLVPFLAFLYLIAFVD